MRYYDVVAMARVDGGVAARLGYKRILTSEDIRVVERHAGSSRYIIRSSEPGLIFKALGEDLCMGVIFKGNAPVKKLLEKAASSGKPIIIPASEITCATGSAFMRATYGLRSVLSYCVKAGAPVAMASLAASESALLSSMQMLELARFVGASPDRAKEMLGRIGEVYDN